MFYPKQCRNKRSPSFQPIQYTNQYGQHPFHDRGNTIILSKCLNEIKSNYKNPKYLWRTVYSLNSKTFFQVEILWILVPIKSALWYFFHHKKYIKYLRKILWNIWTNMVNISVKIKYLRSKREKLSKYKNKSSILESRANK